MADENVSSLFAGGKKLRAVSLTGCTGALPCALGIVGEEGGRLLMER